MQRLQLEKDPKGPYWRTTRTLPVSRVVTTLYRTVPYFTVTTGWCLTLSEMTPWQCHRCSLRAIMQSFSYSFSCPALFLAQVGTYYYKFIINGDQWTYSPDLPLTAPDGDQNVNNYSVVRNEDSRLLAYSDASAQQ